MARKKKWKKKKKRSAPPTPLPLLSRLGLGRGSLLLWITAAAITLVCLVLVVRLPSSKGKPVQERPRTAATQPQGENPVPTVPKRVQPLTRPVTAAVPIQEPAAAGKPAPHPPAPKPSDVEPVSPFSAYEEALSDDVEQRSREVDLIILQSVIAEGLTASSFKHRDVQVHHANGQRFHHQTLLIHIPGKEARFIGTLRSGLASLARETTLIRDERRSGEWEIRVQGLSTHRLVFHDSIPKPHPPVPDQAPPRLVIVIDDLGESIQQARALAKLPFPVVFSVLPHNTRTAETVELARSRGIDVLLHLPMEPNGYPYTANPGPGALFVGMPEADVLDVLEANLRRIPGAIGVNNHMGSRFTEDEAGMRIVLTELKRRNLFFLDSMTSSRSMAPSLTKEIETGFLRRDIFLDNVQDVDMIVHQLRKAEKLAVSKGMAVAIGHPYPETIQALQRWAGLRNGGIRVSSISSIHGQRMVASGE
jgi:uncharacterized protein